MACCGVTRAGRKCALTSKSALKEADPLRKGDQYCIFHAQPFVTHACMIQRPHVMEILFLDLETTGVDITRDRIVEFAAVQAFQNSILPGLTFDTTVAVEPSILEARGQEAAKVHGITPQEIFAGPAFPEVWRRFICFVESLSNTCIQDVSLDSDDEQELPVLPTISEEPPLIVIAAHNGIKFDFAVLLFECHRHNVDMSFFEQWLFVDTMSIMSITKDVTGSCLKLQCLASNACDKKELQAHRARDDCVALWRVMQYVAARLGMDLKRLLSIFTTRIDLNASLAQVISMIETDSAQRVL